MTSRPWLALVVAVGFAAGCDGERPRPGPNGPEVRANLAVRLTAPANGETVLGGKTVAVRVEAEDLDGAGLTGIGMVGRHAATTLDSQVVTFDARADSVHVFQYAVPNSFPTSTQLDLRGLAFGIGEARRASEIRSVVMVQCSPQVPICQ